MSVQQLNPQLAPTINRGGLNQGTLNRNPGIPDRNPGGGDGAPLMPDQNMTATIDTNEFVPSQMATNSALMLRTSPCTNVQPTCWFEPLGYCSDGFNRNGWCSWHLHHFFNGQNISQPDTICKMVQVNGQLVPRLEVVKSQRFLTYLPMPLNPSLVRVFPLIETYETLDDLERNLNFGMLVYTLRHSTKRSEQEINKIVMEHKAFFMLMMEAMVSNSETSRRSNVVIDPIIRINTAACVNYVSENLRNKPYDIHLIMTVPGNANGPTSLQHLNLKRCTTLTQSIALLFELPYRYSPELNVSLAAPAAFMVTGNDIVCDESKMSHGTIPLENRFQTYGTPCTLSLFRSDNERDVSFYTNNYSRSSERCLRSNIDRKKLLDYVIPGRNEE
jgi:hypothetical protein